MKSIEDVYVRLKKKDSENRLTLNEEKKEIKLIVNANYTILAQDDYVVVIKDDKEYTHFHPDFFDLYDYLLELIQNPKEMDKYEISKGNFVKKTIPYIIIILINVIASLIWDCECLVFILIFGSIVAIILVLLVMAIVFKIIEKLYYYKTKSLDEEDINMILNFINASDYWVRNLNCYPTFKYFYKVCNKFRSFPKNISIPMSLNLNKNEMLEIEKSTQNKKDDLNEKDLYDYYILTQEAINVVKKYYDETGKRKKL